MAEIKMAIRLAGGRYGFDPCAGYQYHAAISLHGGITNGLARIGIDYFINVTVNHASRVGEIFFFCMVQHGNLAVISACINSRLFAEGAVAEGPSYHDGSVYSCHRLQNF